MIELSQAMQWRIATPAPQQFIERASDLHPVVAQVLYNRGLAAPEEIAAFFSDTGASENPFLLRDMDVAVTLIRRIVLAGGLIAVYGDYDVDGVTATAILAQTLNALGAEVCPYIPDREEEGYGLNPEALRTLAEAGVQLLITVDCGIRSLDEVALARSLGMAVIVTDHHHISAALPPADAVINPRREDSKYSFRELAGAGVAFKLAQALLRTNAQVPLSTTRRVLPENDLLDLAALGTVADMVPLLGENRDLVRRGLVDINAGRRPGVAALIEVSGQQLGQVTAMLIGYTLAPRLNAAGRLSHASTALDLLMAADMSVALPLARELDTLNRERQQLTEQVQMMAQAEVGDVGVEQPLLFAVSSTFPPGVIGLAAGRLMEQFYRPAIVVEQGEEFSKGSARSIPEFHITEAFDSVSELLEQYGGHAAAAGFTVRTERLPALRERLLALAAERLGDLSLSPEIYVDAETPLHTLSWQLCEAFEALQPFGYGNLAPVLVSRYARVVSMRPVGADGRHLKLALGDANGRVWDAIAFRQGHWVGRLPNTIDVAYTFERNEWNGNVRLQLNIKDIHVSR